MNLVITVDGSHGIYIGGKDDAKNKTALKQHGITHILNMTPEKDSSIQMSPLHKLHTTYDFMISISCWHK
ncbi:dual specificity MAP kinase phosphatase [Chaetoceros tenuissimus]|uniref:Dual specificity MAP kinase phosphatase n=1 Tax=Chaetoceros tenuissimus TaxID=426638 RepID=A0AAD3CMY5_9STRA|nr:dual specificity MAP kinase phosphatase [Chaetoceros tenuissimus]